MYIGSPRARADIHVRWATAHVRPHFTPPPITVIEYTTKLDFILEKLNAAHQGESGSGLATTAE